VTGDVELGQRFRDQARAWLAVDPDPETRAELQAILDRGEDHRLEELFGGCLAFGTAGLRARMGPGPMQMNRVVVRRATAGLMRSLPAGAVVVIGHDARKNSHAFALDVARVVVGNAGRALLLPAFAPTPLVAFAVRYLGTDAGVVSTASHNPPDDNGLKVYLSDGAQVVPPADARIAAAIEEVGTQLGIADADDPRIEHLDATIEQAYLDHVARLRSSLDEDGRVPRNTVEKADEPVVVYSPLHGVGARFTLAAFDRAGLASPVVVAAQREPDGSFPTVATPNPEDPDATQLARDEAVRRGAAVALIHDPDADRLGVMAPVAGNWRALTGNEIGLLLADHILTHTTGGDRLVVDTIVSSSALARLAASHGVHHVTTLTGFKWIVRPALEHPDWRFVFGYEEALGFSVDAYVRDKDGISAALVFADLVGALATAGQTVSDRLEALAVRDGLFATANWALAGRTARDVELVMDRLRNRLPSSLGSVSVVHVQDFRTGGDLPATDLLQFELAPDARLSIRPSGTEAKLKVYAEVVMPVEGAAAYHHAVEAAEARLEELRAATMPMLEALTTD
jgi:phosphomannomutase